MSVTYESAARLFNEGEFSRLIELSGETEQARIVLEPRHRVVVANALALLGEFDEARRLAELDCGSPAAPAIRSQAEWTLGLVMWRTGHISSAAQHARTAVRLAHESADAERIAWALLHLFRLSIHCGPMDAIMAALPEVRRAVARAGVSRASAYLHDCVAVLEGQTGRLDEARRHLDIAESLLHLAPNSWLAGLVQMDRGAVASHECEFELAYNHLRSAKEIAKHIGYQQNTVANGTLGHLQFLVGELDKSKRTLLSLRGHVRASISVRLGVLDSLARVHLALGELDECENVIEEINKHVCKHPEVASMFQVRRAALVRAQLLAKKGRGDEALKCLQAAQEIARELHDVPLDAAAHLQMAQVYGKARHCKAASLHLLEAERLEITTIRELQASYYYGAAHALSEGATSLKQHLRDRALRLWAEQGVRSVRFEIDDVPFSPSRTKDAHQTNPCTVNHVECVTDSLAAFVDLAHRPHLLGEEMLLAINGLTCSPAAKVIEARPNAGSPEPADDTVTLPLGTDHGKRNLTLVCKVPDDPAKAVLLADVLRIGRAAIALERARQEERSRAALWPAPPIEEQAGALFLAEEMQTILATVRRVAPTTAPVLITGETGTGKEVVARTIHAYSNRASATFRPFNCSGVPKEMLDSQLFGHRKGSFTGANEHFPGVIRSAAGGTLFLDEIGETTLEVQPKLLRFLESNEVHPIGEVQAVRADVRIIAATNTDLDMLVAQGRFREDLFYRLNIVRLRLPPLRERRVEIPPLAHHYLQKHAQEYGKGTLRLAEETMEYLVLYRWPGNVRQLANEMRRMAALAETDAVMMPEHLSPDIAASRRTVPPSERSLDSTEVVVRMDQPMSAAVQHLECAMIQRAMRLTGGRIEETAALLGLSRKGLYLKRVRYGLESRDPGPGALA
jgi:DNA-binding NtrC family response regulator/tetratricopeptide (TPR) repeat protein